MNKPPFRITFYQAVSAIPFIVFLMILLVGCGVKERPGQTSQVMANLPAGVSVSQTGKFFVAGNVAAVRGNEDNTIRYRIVDNQLEPVGAAYTFETTYRMPDMAMVIDPATTKVIEAGVVEFTYHIPHGGKWEFVVIIKKDGKELDRATFIQEVAH